MDLIVDRPGLSRCVIEIKSKVRVQNDDAHSLLLLGQDIDPHASLYLLSQDPLQQKIGPVRCLPWHIGIQEVFNLTSPRDLSLG